MEYLPLSGPDDWQAPRPCAAVSVELVCALADDIDAYLWANQDTSTPKLVAVITECCNEAGLSVGEA